MWEIDELKLCRDSTYSLPNGITINIPKLGDICDFGEEKYLSTISLLTAEPFDMPYQLQQIGIDYTEIKSFELFCLLVSGLTPNETSLIFGDLNFSNFRIVEKNGFLVMINSDGIEINEFTMELIKSCIRKIHHIPKQRYNGVFNEFAKEQIIRDAKADIERAQRKRKLLGAKSQYLPLISSLVVSKGFNYNWSNIWDMTIAQFFDSFYRLQKRDNAENLYHGLYSGCIDYSKIKKDLNWFEPFKE